MSDLLLDFKGYSERQKEIDAAIVAAVAVVPQTYLDLMQMLRALGIGDATSDEQLALSYSSTGRICRTATNSLCGRKLIHSTFGMGIKGPTLFIAGPRPKTTAPLEAANG